MKDPAQFEAALLQPLPGEKATPTPIEDEQEGSDWLALYAQVNGGSLPGPPSHDV